MVPGECKNAPGAATKAFAVLIFSDFDTTLCAPLAYIQTIWRPGPFGSFQVISDTTKDPKMKSLKLTLASAVALSLAACAGETPETDAAETPAVAQPAGTIVDVAVGDESFSTLVAAVTAADLGGVLSGEGPFTVFAPTNDAFGKLPEGTVEKLTTEEIETLTAVLQYHVVSGAVDAATLTAAIAEAGEAGYTVTTVGGGTFTANVVDGAVVLTDAAGNTSTVTSTDIEASNGLIHVVDTVLMPQ